MPDYIYLPTNSDRRILEIIPASAVSLQSAKKVPFIVNFVSKKINLKIEVIMLLLKRMIINTPIASVFCLRQSIS
jgi:hypothetical protein